MWGMGAFLGVIVIVETAVLRTNEIIPMWLSSIIYAVCGFCFANIVKRRNN